MNHLLTLFAALVSGCVMLLLPGIAAFAGFQSLNSILDTEAEINARLVSQLINVNPELWKVETLRLEDLLRRRPSDKTPENRSVLDLQDRVISELSDQLARPLIEKRWPVHDAGEVVGAIRIQRSLQPLMAHVAWFALAGSLLAGAIFAALKLSPLQALRRAQDRLVHEATHDGLTGLPNRVLFRDRLKQAMARAKQSRRPMALMFMDLDNFKDINDSLGHETGDLVLRHVANVLGNSLSTGTGPPLHPGFNPVADLVEPQTAMPAECPCALHATSARAAARLGTGRRCRARVESEADGVSLRQAVRRSSPAW